MSKLLIARATKPVGMLVVAGLLLVAAVVPVESWKKVGQQEVELIFACYAQVSYDKNYTIFSTWSHTESRPLADFHENDSNSEHSERIQCHLDKCQPVTSLKKCHESIRKSRNLLVDYSADDKNNRWEHQACYMVVARPSTLVRVHSGSWPDSRWVKQSVDKNGFEHKLCHYDECNSHSIDICRRLLRRTRAPKGSRQASEESKTCMKVFKLIRGEHAPINLTSNIFNSKSGRNQWVDPWRVKCHDGACSQASIEKCGPWIWKPFRFSRGAFKPRWVHDYERIAWDRAENNICVKSLTGGWTGQAGLTSDLESSNGQMFRPTGRESKCHEGACTQASIEKCGPWVRLEEGELVVWEPNESFPHIPGDGRVRFIKKKKRPESQFSLDDD